MREIKKQLFAFCASYIEQKIIAAQRAMEKAQNEANQETKSSAGDKHETGRSMMQLEKQKYALHLQQALRLKKSFAMINKDESYELVEKGAVVETDNGNFFVAIAAGRVKLEKEYVCISLASPLGLALESAEEGDIVVFRDKEIEIFSIF